MHSYRHKHTERRTQKLTKKRTVVCWSGNEESNGWGDEKATTHSQRRLLDICIMYIYMNIGLYDYGFVARFWETKRRTVSRMCSGGSETVGN